MPPYRKAGQEKFDSSMSPYSQTGHQSFDFAEPSRSQTGHQTFDFAEPSHSQTGQETFDFPVPSNQLAGEETFDFSLFNNTNSNAQDLMPFDLGNPLSDADFEKWLEEMNAEDAPAHSASQSQPASAPGPSTLSTSNSSSGSFVRPGDYLNEQDGHSASNTKLQQHDSQHGSQHGSQHDSHQTRASSQDYGHGLFVQQNSQLEDPSRTNTPFVDFSNESTRPLTASAQDQDQNHSPPPSNHSGVANAIVTFSSAASCVPGSFWASVRSDARTEGMMSSLRYNSVNEANKARTASCNKRREILLPSQDPSWPHTEIQKKFFVAVLIDSLNRNPTTTESVDGIRQAAVFETQLRKEPALAEASMWALVENVVDARRTGIQAVRDHRARKHTQLFRTFSEHISAIAFVLRESKAVASSVSFQFCDRHSRLVDDPIGTKGKSVANAKLNGHRSTLLKEARAGRSQNEASRAPVQAPAKGKRTFEEVCDDDNKQAQRQSVAKRPATRGPRDSFGASRESTFQNFAPPAPLQGIGLYDNADTPSMSLLNSGPPGFVAEAQPGKWYDHWSP